MSEPTFLNNANSVASTQATEPSLNLPPLSSDNFYRFHTVIKPIGAQCNLSCSYCFYLLKEQLLEQPKNPRMSVTILEAHIRQYIEAQTGNEVIFS